MAAVPHLLEPDAALYRAHLDTLDLRLQDALQAAGAEALLVHAGSPAYAFRDDQTYPHRANPTFKAWVPLVDAPDSFLYLRPGRPPQVLLHSPEDYWHLPAQVPSDAWTRHVQIQPVRDRAEARRALPASLQRVAYVGEPFPELLAWGVGAINPGSLLARLEYARAVKTPYELACLRAASRLGVAAHHAAEAAFRAGGSEYDIAVAFMAGCGQREQELPYNPIVALNEHGAVLHYQHLDRTPPAARRSLLIDAGATYRGYASDITRTWVAPGQSDFEALVGAMDGLQRRLCGQVRAGVDWREVHLDACRGVAEILVDAGLVTCPAEQAVDSGLVRVFFPHGIGHLLGLQVHEPAGLAADPSGHAEIPRPAGHPFLRLTRRLEPGFVVTMEPGLYFIPALLAAARADAAQAGAIDWARVAALAPCGGIRIEDNLAVTAEGCENLTRDAW